MVNIRRSTRALALLCLLPSVTACPGDDDGAAGAADPALVGIWELTDDGEVEVRYTFEEDGAFAFDELGDDEDAEHVRGDYTVDDGVLLMEGNDTAGDDPGRAETTYHAGGGLLAIGAYLAVGGHDGPVGTWRARSVGESLDGAGEPISIAGFDIELELRDDGTLSLDATVFGDDGETDSTGEGTWTDDGDAVTVSFSVDDGRTATVELLILGDDAMGDVVLDRLSAAAEISTAPARDPIGAPRRSAAARGQDSGPSIATAFASATERDE